MLLELDMCLNEKNVTIEQTESIFVNCVANTIKYTIKRMEF